MSQDERHERRQARITETDAETRAQMTQLRQMMNQRRQDLGLPAGGGGGWGGR